MRILDKYWKILMWLPIIFLIVSIGVMLNNIAATGSFLKRDIDLSGGKLITVEVKGADIDKIKAALPYANVRLTSGLTKNLLVEMPFDKNATDVLTYLQSNVDLSSEPSIRTVGPSLGSLFFQQAQLALIAAFILMAITVFLIFRSPVPSSIVLLAALTDILGTIAVLSFIDVHLSLPVLAALLTLIGYSVDTDILLTNELLKGKGDFHLGIMRAMKTGITMTMTTLVALVAMYFVSGAFVIEQIALVLFIGLIIDMPATWLANAGILRWWLERKQRKGGLHE
jgi:preprotein translocase subunit SecF